LPLLVCFGRESGGSTCFLLLHPKLFQISSIGLVPFLSDVLLFCYNLQAGFAECSMNIDFRAKSSSLNPMNGGGGGEGGKK
jgi:hypothetical protein